jgi:hypothetical protein
MEKTCLTLEPQLLLLNEKDLLIQKQQEQINNLELKFNRLKDQYDHLHYLFRLTNNSVDIDFLLFQK